MLAAFLAAVCVPVYAQREPRDRPDSVGSRSIRAKDGADRDRREERPGEPAPDAFIEEQKRTVRSTANMTALRAARAAATREDQYKAAYEQALRDYDTIYKDELKKPENKNRLVALKAEDYARAYILAVDPAVGARTDGFRLALLRSQVKVYNGYEKVLRAAVPGLSDDAIESLTDEAKRVVEALSSND